MSDNDLDLDLDLDVDLDIDLTADDDQPTQAVPMLATPAAPPRPEGLFIFEPEGDEAWRVMSGMGIHGTRATLGSDIMAAAQDRRLTGVIVAPVVDAELRELFVRALRGRFGAIPVVYLSPEAHDPEAVAMMRAQGATAVFPWPPARAQIVPALKELMQLSPSSPGLPEKGSKPATDEMKLLTRKLPQVDKGELAARQTGKPPEAVNEVPRDVFEQAVREVAQRSAENTSLRSELTIYRQRTQLLEERLDRLTKDLSALTHERDELRARLVDQPSGPQLNLQVQERLESIKKIGDSVDSFLWGLEQAIQFLEELQLEAGDARAPSLAAHLRSIKLVRVLLERLRERTRGL